MIAVDRAEDLWAIDPDEFVAARSDLVKRLRSAGEKELARQVASLRRPPRTAWALNLLAQQHPEQIDAIRETSDALAAAFTGDGSDVRSRQAEYRSAVEQATSTAVDLAGLSGEAMRSRVRDTLLAASADNEVDEQLRTATVTEDHAAPGFAAAPGGSPHRTADRPVPPPRPTRSRPTRTSAKPGAEKPAAERVAADKPAIDEVAERRATAAARKRIEQARLDADRLRRRALSLTAKADEADRRAAEARRAADDAIVAADAADEVVAESERGRP